MQRAGNEKMSSSLMNIPVAAGAIITEGTMVAINSSGYAVKASKTASQITAGVCMKYTDNQTGDNGDVSVLVKRGAFVFNNSSTGVIRNIDLLKNCYVENENTITITAEGSSIAGKIIAVEDDGVTVEIA